MKRYTITANGRTYSVSAIDIVDAIIKVEDEFKIKAHAITAVVEITPRDSVGEKGWVS